MSKGKEYVPMQFRPEKREVREVMYAIGTEHSPGEFGMCHGPHPDENEMLEKVGMSRKDCIIRFNEDGTDEVIWRWSGDSWINLKKLFGSE